MARPILAFLTDFGLTDHYVGAMKGVALGICPEASLIDVTHGIAPQDVLGGALELAAACPYFPSGTVFVVVVDPGVGSTRRAIAVEAGGQRFVAPDNGVLTLACARTPPDRVVDLQASRYARTSISRTFEGRDRFTPAAAWLAAGIDLGSLGPLVERYEQLSIPHARVVGTALDGEVLRADRFGNLITSIDRAAFDAWAAGADCVVHVAGVRAGSVVGTYADAPPGALCALFGSSDRLEVAVHGGSAADRIEAARGAAIRIEKQPPRTPGRDPGPC